MEILDSLADDKNVSHFQVQNVFLFVLKVHYIHTHSILVIFIIQSKQDRIQLLTLISTKFWFILVVLVIQIIYWTQKD